MLSVFPVKGKRISKAAAYKFPGAHSAELRFFVHLHCSTVRFNMVFNFVMLHNVCGCFMKSL